MALEDSSQHAGDNRATEATIQPTTARTTRKPRSPDNVVLRLPKLLREKVDKMLESGVSYREIAKVAGCHFSVIGKYKRQVLDPAREIARKAFIADTLEGAHVSEGVVQKATGVSIAAGVTGIASRIERLKALQDRHLRMQTVMAERAEDMANVPGGKSGLLVRQLKQLGSGDTSKIVEEYKLDTGLLTEFREHEKQMAMELGEWSPGENSLAAGGIQTINVLMMPVSAPKPEPAKIVDAPEDPAAKT